MTNILIEGLSIGLLTGIVGFIIATLLMFIEPGFSLAKYHFWFRIFLGAFISGFLIHIILEYSGANKKYCEQKLKMDNKDSATL